MMVEHINKVLEDPKRVCPDYGPEAGYELAGFVWLQGFNDLVDGQTYPNKNYDEYHTYIWWRDDPHYRSIVLGEEQIKYLKKGKNVLAVYANDQYDLNSPEHYAAIDVRIEGITNSNKEKLERALEEVLSPKDREALQGASNGGYHYFGSAKIFAQMGKAFAEAMPTLDR